MKRIYGIALAVAALFSLAACSNKIEYKWVPYVSLGTFGGDVTEEAGSIQVPVLLCNADAADVSFSVAPASAFGVGSEATDAVEGVNYSIASPVDGVVKLTKDNPEASITINITDIDGYTGNLSFVLGIESKTEGVQNGANTLILITIKDTDHPLGEMFGDWKLYGTALNEETEELYYAAGMPFKVSAYDGDPTKIWISNIVPMGYYYGSYLGNCQVYAEVSDDMSTIKIPVPQALTKASYDNLFGPGLGAPKLYNWPGFGDGATGSTEAGYLTFTYNEDKGAYFTDDSWGIASDSIVADNDWLYYECNVITDAAAPEEPTYIIQVKQ